MLRNHERTPFVLENNNNEQLASNNNNEVRFNLSNKASEGNLNRSIGRSASN